MSRRVMRHPHCTPVDAKPAMKPTPHHSKHCHLCGRRLRGRAWVHAPGATHLGSASHPEQNIIVCRQCEETAPRCDVCNLPMGENHVRLPDNRRICPRCHQTAIYDPTQARELFERVTHIATDQLGLGLNVGTEFTLVDHQHLQRLATEAPAGPHDDAGKVIGLFTRKGRQRVMYLLYGLPQILFIQVAAHEWGHAWHRENCPLLDDLLLCEGFAEWVAHKALQTLGATRQATLMEQRDGLYGEGLRKMLSLERQRGISGVLDFCRRSE
ncbi:MAG TPA: protein DA1 [Thermoflexia bacterium]|nr:protein DA1 [Thermoflexia bacterium]